LCYERRFSEQSSVIRLKQTFWSPSNIWAGYATGTFYAKLVCITSGFDSQCLGGANEYRSWFATHIISTDSIPKQLYDL